MEYFHQGNNHYIDEDYDDAEIFYSKAISEYENSVKQPQQQYNNNNNTATTTTIYTNELLSKIYLHRGTTYLKLKKYYQALEDYNVCIRINLNILTMEIVYYRKGLTYFELEEYESAKECFKKGLDLLNQIQNSNTNTIIKHSKRDINSYIRYIRKCDVEIEGR